METARSSQFRLRLFQPEAHAHLAVHGRRGGEVLTRRLALASDPGEPAEAEVAVGDEGSHTERLRERQRLAVVAGSALGVACRRDVTGKAEGVGLVPRAPSRRVSASASRAWLAASSIRPAER